MLAADNQYPTDMDDGAHDTRTERLPPAGLPHSAAPALLIERAVLTSIADGVVVNDVTGKVKMINRAAAQLLQADSQGVVGEPVHTLFQAFSSRGRMTIVEAMDRLYADPYSFSSNATPSGQSGITETVIEGGRCVIQAHISPVLSEIGEFMGIVTVLRDITAEAEAERAKTEFVSNVSHELRTPLTSIKGYSDLLLSRVVGPLNDQQRHFIEIIQGSSDRLTTLINDLLDISRIESGRLQLESKPVWLESILREVVEMIHPQCDKKDLTLTLDLEPGVGPVLGDETRLTQIVTNLVSNACRYTPEGGAITLSLSRAGNAVRVDVKDTGIGIAPEDQANVFQRFHRVNDPLVQEVAGTGLGLPIARMLIEMHGGRMWLQSEMGQGSTFTFTLPAHVSEDDVGAMESGRRDTILVVDDESNIADLLALQLRFEGFDVLVATCGQDALKLAQTQHVDLITLDMMLPDITGMEVLRQLKAEPKTAEIPVVIVSVMPPLSGGQAADAADHIRKPFALEKLVGSVRTTLAAAKRRRLPPLPD